MKNTATEQNKVFSGLKRRVAGATDATAGFTLVELIIAVGIAMVISLAIYAMYDSFYRQSSNQDLILESQQNARVGLSLMERELQNAGFAAGTADIVTEATATSVEFRYSDPTSSSISATAGQSLKVGFVFCDPASSGYSTLVAAASCPSGMTYAAIIKKVMHCSNAACTTGTIDSPTEIIPYASSMALTYFNSAGTGITAPVNTQADRNTIRYVDIAITTKTSRAIASSGGTTPQVKTFLIEAHVHLRNVEMGQIVLDTQPPDAPLGPNGGAIQVRDTGRCGRLQVKFQKSVATDVTGYKIYYGTDSAGVFSGYLNIPLTTLTSNEYSCTQSGSDYSCTIYPKAPTHAPLSYTGSYNPSVVPIYYIAVKSYDSSQNESPLSVMAYGDSSTATVATSNTALGSGANDSTINPTKPGPVTGFTGSEPVVGGVVQENKVQLSWNAYDTTNYPDVTELRIYRSTTPFTTYPISPSYLIYTVTNPQATTSYTDEGPGLIGCQTYYYAIAPVNCDTDLILNNTGTDAAALYYGSTDYAVTYGDGSSKPGVDSPAGSDTAPADITPPAAPTLQKHNGVIVSGYKRTFIDFNNPADSDFAYTDLYYDTTSYPTIDTTYGSGTYGVISGGLAVPNTDNVSMGVKGRFYSTNQTISFVHDTDNSGAIQDINTIKSPTLAGAQYYYLAVAYDKCGNPSTSTGNATSLATLCGDGSTTADPEYGPPEAPSGISVSGCYPRFVNYNWQTTYSNPPSGQGTGLTVSWSPVTSSATRNPDLAGYRIFRTSTYTTTGIPTFNTSATPETIVPTAAQAGIPCSTNPWTTCYLGFVPVGASTQYTDNNLTSLTNWQGYNWTYGVVATDCVFENRYITNITGGDGIPPSSFMYNTSKYANAFGYSSGWQTFNGLTSEGANPGLIDRDEKYAYNLYTAKWNTTTSMYDYAYIGPNSTTPDGQRAVLTGVTISNDSASTLGTGETSPKTTFTHDNVMLFLANFANHKQKITSIDIQWINSGAYLSSVSLGGGFGLNDSMWTQDTTQLPTIFWYYNMDTMGNGSQGSKVTQSVPISSTTAGTAPYASRASVSMPTLELNKYRRNIPLSFTFTDSSGAPVDMRGDTLLIQLNYTNQATGTTSCVSYPTVSRDYTGIFVPYGPTITSVVQNKPTSPTSAYPIYADVSIFGGGVVNNVLPTNGTLNSAATVNGSDNTITVTMTASSGTDDLQTGGKVYLDKAVVYYTDTAVTVGTPPSSYPYSSSVSVSAASNLRVGTLSASLPKPTAATGSGSTNRRLWYYIIAYDKEGNWERSPVNGAYTTDWKSFDVCDVIPSAPSSLKSPSSTDVMSNGLTFFTYTSGNSAYNVIRWPRVQTYTSGVPINLTTDPITYKIYRKDTTSGSYALVGSFLDSDTTGNSWTAASSFAAPATGAFYVVNQTNDTGYAEWRDTINASTNDSTYYVTAKNSCTTTVRESSSSPQYRECVGASNGVITVSPASATTSTTPMTSGSPYTVTVLDCPLGNMPPNNVLTDTVYVSGNNTLTAVDATHADQMTETSTTSGMFTASVNTSFTDTSGSSAVYVHPTNTADDSITIACTKADGSAGGCSGTTSTVTVYVTAATCDNRPTNFTVSPTASNNKGSGSTKAGCGGSQTVINAPGFDINWTAVSGDKDPVTGYRIYRKETSGGTWNQIATCGASSTTYSDRVAGMNTTSGYYYYYVVPIDGCTTTSSSADAIAPTGTSSNPAGVSVMKCPAANANPGASCNLALP